MPVRLTTLTAGLATAARRVLHAPDDSAVHFHSGPSGGPTPCYDPRCPMPRLDA